MHVPDMALNSAHGLDDALIQLLKFTERAISD